MIAPTDRQQHNEDRSNPSSNEEKHEQDAKNHNTDRHQHNRKAESQNKGGHNHNPATNTQNTGGHQHDQKIHEKIEGTVDNRKCRDVTFLIAFLMCIGGMVSTQESEIQ